MPTYDSSSKCGKGYINKPSRFLRLVNWYIKCNKIENASDHVMKTENQMRGAYERVFFQLQLFWWSNCHSFFSIQLLQIFWLQFEITFYMDIDQIAKRNYSMSMPTIWLTIWICVAELRELLSMKETWKSHLYKSNGSFYFLSKCVTRICASNQNANDWLIKLVDATYSRHIFEHKKKLILNHLCFYFITGVFEMKKWQSKIFRKWYHFWPYQLKKNLNEHFRFVFIFMFKCFKRSTI